MMGKILDAFLTPALIVIGTIMAIVVLKVNSSWYVKALAWFMLYIIFINPVLYQMAKSQGCYDGGIL
ncbi:hypothetical protein LCGC14_3017250 [marine sediment metagenome]|uniref:Uncharacterized protein n=1 Tax=marine sediment metagenome TaxID=412755 RepID=A0A0F8ZMH5_9ZZZZ